MNTMDEDFKKYFNFDESELFIGLTGPLGTDLNTISDQISKILLNFGYKTFSLESSGKKNSIKISREIINYKEQDNDHNLILKEKRFPNRFKKDKSFENRNKNSYSKNKAKKYKDGLESKFDCSERQMEWGDIARSLSDENSILACMVIEIISKIRTEIENENSYKSNVKVLRRAYIIQGLKRPEEIMLLRQVYGSAFFLVGVYSEKHNRQDYLTRKGMSNEEACIQLERDENETVNKPYGQASRDTFGLSDFFINQDWKAKATKNALERYINLIFGNPYITPTFDEYAMFSAYSVSLMSLDLARQVGAVISTPYEEIVATGCAEVPKYGGGNYYTQHEEGFYWEHPKGRDIEYGRNPNKQRISELVDEILIDLKNNKDIQKKMKKNKIKFYELLNKECLEEGPLKSLIEFMRSSHAESEAILSCARNGIPTRGCTMYCTTMPCHECGKRIIGAGIDRVIFIEPYSKSKTLSQHSDSTNLGFEKVDGKVRFEPFVGVGPRKFIDLFSMQIGSGYPTVRQDKKGYPHNFEPENAILRNSLYPISYRVMEERIIENLKDKIDKNSVEFNFELKREQSKSQRKS